MVVGATAIGGLALIGKLVYDYCTSDNSQEKNKGNKAEQNSGRDGR